MSAAPDIVSARRRRLLGLISQMGLSTSEAAALLRSTANDIEPTAEFRRLQEIIPVVAANEPAKQKKARSDDAERQRRRRYRQARGLRVLRATAAVDDERIARLVQAGLIPDGAVDSDADLLDELLRVVMEIADAL